MRLTRKNIIGSSVVLFFLLVGLGFGVRTGVQAQPPPVKMEWELSGDKIKGNQDWFRLKQQDLADARALLAEEKRRKDDNIYELGKLDGFGYVYDWTTDTINPLFPR